ncbi:hypothetical protein B7463_g2645, partial [Scytalidium lignicola]
MLVNSANDVNGSVTKLFQLAHIVHGSAVILNNARQTSQALPLLDPFSVADISSRGMISQSMIDLIITHEAFKLFRTTDNILSIAEIYFRTMHSCLPFISKEVFYGRVGGIWTQPKGDFALLVICMHTLPQTFINGITEAVKSPVYALAKSMLSLIESANILTLEIVQSRLLVCLYEMGHAIQPAAFLSVSIAARGGVTLGIHKSCAQQTLSNHKNWQNYEEEKRVWWAIFILHTYINLLAGSCHFVTEDPSVNDQLPVDDELWQMNIVSDQPSLSLLTPTNIRVGPFARAVQVTHILRRVLTHVLKVTADPIFNADEAQQLDDTLKAFAALLPEQLSQSSTRFCGALGICTSQRWGIAALYLGYLQDISSTA